MSTKPVLLRNFDFLRVWIGQVLSQSGTRMYQIAVVWCIVTSSRAETGKVAAVFLVLCALPSLLFVKAIGRLVDTYSTRKVLLAADLLKAIVMGAFAVMLYKWPHAPVAIIYAAGFILSLLQAIIDPALTKAVAEIVPPEDIEGATAFQTSTISVGYYIGAGLGAILIAVLHTAGVIAVNAAAHLLSFALVWISSFRYAPPKPPASAEGGLQMSAWKYLEREPLLKKLLLGMGLANFLCVPTFLVLPIYVNRALNSGASTVAWIESGLWLGILVGTALSRRVRFISDPEQLGAVCTVVLAIGLGVPGFVVSAPGYFAMIFLQGLAFSLMPVRFISLFHQRVPNEMKGRFFALMGAVLTAAQPICHFAAGALVDRMPVTMVCVIQGTLMLFVTLYFLLPRVAAPGKVSLGGGRV